MRYMILTFGFLGWGFYELSGGADFVPHSANQTIAENSATAATVEHTQTIAAAEPAVQRVDIATRNAGLSLTAITQTTDQDDLVVQASLSQPEPAAETYQFESLVEGAPTAADLLDQARAEEILNQPDPVITEAAVSTDPLWQVSGRRVNMRSGPGTNHGVVATLDQGSELELVDTSNGWAQVRVVESGRIGWMAERLIQPAG